MTQNRIHSQFKIYDSQKKKRNSHFIFFVILFSIALNTMMARKLERLNSPFSSSTSNTHKIDLTLFIFLI